MKILPGLITMIGEAIMIRKVHIQQKTWASNACTITPGLLQRSALCSISCTVQRIYSRQTSWKELGGHIALQTIGLHTAHAETNRWLLIVYRRISIGLEHDVKEIMVEYTKKKRRLCGALWTTMQWKPRCRMSISIVRQWTVDSKGRQYLGIVFDRTPNGNAQISRIITKARRGLNTLKVVARDRVPLRKMPLFVDMLVILQVDYGFRMLTLSNTHSVDMQGCKRNTPAVVIKCGMYLGSAQ